MRRADIGGQKRQRVIAAALLELGAKVVCPIIRPRLIAVHQNKVEPDVLCEDMIKVVIDCLVAHLVCLKTLAVH